MIAKPIRRSQLKRRRTVRRSSRTLSPAYLAFLHTLPCFVCYREAYEFLGSCMVHVLDPSLTPVYDRQKSPTEAAHVGLSTSRRGMSQKFPDEEAIPLCCAHHREGPGAIHILGPDEFFRLHGCDRDSIIRLFQGLYAEHLR